MLRHFNANPFVPVYYHFFPPFNSLRLGTSISVYAMPTYHKQERFDIVLVRNHTKYRLDTPWICIRQLFKFSCQSITTDAWALVEPLGFVDSSYPIHKSTGCPFVKFTESFAVIPLDDIWQSVQLIENLQENDGSYWVNWDRWDMILNGNSAQWFSIKERVLLQISFSVTMSLSSCCFIVGNSTFSAGCPSHCESRSNCYKTFGHLACASGKSSQFLSLEQIMIKFMKRLPTSKTRKSS